MPLNFGLEKSPEDTIDSQENMPMDHQINQLSIPTPGTNNQVQIILFQSIMQRPSSLNKALALGKVQ